MNKIWIGIVAAVAGLGLTCAYATLRIPMYVTTADGQGRYIGKIRADDTIYGLIMTPRLKDLPPGWHGFHVYSEPSCDHFGLAGGGHLDPDKSHDHRGPYENGHLGDMPVLIVYGNGHATMPVLAPRLKLAYIMGKAIMIDIGGDNYSDRPDKMGGGGSRIACGIVPYH